MTDLEQPQKPWKKISRRAIGVSYHVISHLEDAVTITKNLAILFLFAMATPFIYKLLSKNTIVVQEITVPQELESRGLSGRVFSQRVIDKILEIANYTEALKEREDVYGLSKKNQLPDIDLPITIFGLNFETLMSFFKTTVGGQDIRVTGEVVTEQPGSVEAKELSRFGVRLRVAKIGTIYRSKDSSSEIDTLAERAAMGVMEQYEPITMAYYYRGHRDFENAFRMTEKAILLKRPGDVVWAHFVRGLIESDQARWAAAEDEFRFVLEREPDFPRARNNLSLVLRRKGDFDAALAEAEEAIRVEPNRGQSYRNKAWALIGMGRMEDAVPWLQKTIDVEPGNEAGHLDMGDYYRQMRDLDRAAFHYRAATDIKPDNSQIYANLAGTLGDLGRWDEAEKVTLKSLSINPKNGIALGYIGYIALQHGNIERARKYYTDAFAADPAYFRYYIGMARIAMAEKDYRKAAELLEKARIANPRWWDTYKFKGDLALLENHTSDAMSLYEQSAKLNPRAPDVQARIASLAEKLGEREKARKAAKEAVRLAPYLYANEAFVLHDFKVTTP